ncbi:hypothetical protein [Methylobacterium sp. J-076]|uniref:hypothetical protein n=1 Tax=Methylobacterium sp. J-076 TaxID=2836655 RepID=UPI001FBB5751|nr:hypothetical protein [Methylobacterium sp. J-076]MCJ2014980.1 hypothetical protein [Methylobacterium sp. J-076]
MIPRHLLQHDDFLWALDHSTRRYRVREARAGDRPPGPVRSYAGLITLVRIDSGALLVLAACCGVSPDEWVDSDAYADFRLLAISRKHALRDFRGRS